MLPFSAMEASVRLTNLHGHSLLTKHHHHSLRFPPNPPSLLSFTPPKYPNSRINCISRSSISPPFSNPISFLLSLSSTHLSNPSISNERVSFDSKENYFLWNRAPGGVSDGGNLGVSKGKTALTVVMLGWLGAEQKHLKRYIELYTAKGIDAISFVVPVKEILGFDLGKRVESRLLALTEELISWLSEKEENGRERNLVFHTFSNTGWFAYGAILNYLQSRGEFMDKIKGCVVDSGPDAEIDPQVWAAGFSAALLKKRSSSTLPSAEPIDKRELQPNEDVSKVEDAEPLLLETLLLKTLEKLFSFIFKLPDVNRRLTKIIATLSKNQPPCPQLYLYSTADKIIRSERVESFIQGQKILGRKVRAYKFVSSPHVDHYRSFPHIYSAELDRFLKECVTTVSHK